MFASLPEASNGIESLAPCWSPSTTYTQQEKFLLKRLKQTRKLFKFLREHRHELFDDEFQTELESMYRKTGAGKEPVPPALLAMATLLQAYHGMPDAEAVEMTVVDLRWQLVLDRLGASQTAFSQGALSNFRARLIHHDMDRRLLDRTVTLALRTKEFDAKKLPKTLRVAIDSMPLEGAGRVEDTINLLAHAGRKLLAKAGERVAVEHRLAHVGRKQGRRARYLGVRKNLFDLRRAAAVVNLEVIDRRVAEAA